MPGFERISASTEHLRDHLHRVPALLLLLMPGRPEGAGLFLQASLFGSILPAV